MEKTILNSRIKLIKGNITELDVDVIVNAANNSLLGGGGVDGAIHEAGGEEILKECIKIRKKQGGCKTGEAVITTGGKLQAKYVIHTVGPIWNGGGDNEDELLKSCYYNSLKLASENKMESIAFPSISTGVYEFPKDRAAKIALETITEFLANNELPKHVLIVTFSYRNFKIYRDMMVE